MNFAEQQSEGQIHADHEQIQEFMIQIENQLQSAKDLERQCQENLEKSEQNIKNVQKDIQKQDEWINT